MIDPILLEMGGRVPLVLTAIKQSVSAVKGILASSYISGFTSRKAEAFPFASEQLEDSGHKEAGEERQGGGGQNRMGTGVGVGRSGPESGWATYSFPGPNPAALIHTGR